MKFKIFKSIFGLALAGLFLVSCTAEYSDSFQAVDASRNVGLKLNCGDPYGGIWFAPPDPDLSSTEVGQKLDQIAWIDDSFTYRNFDGEKVKTSIRREIINTLRTPSSNFGRGNIQTPIGSEIAVGEALKKVGFTTSYEGLKDGCGGAQVSYFTVPKSVGDLKQADIFESYLIGKMSQFAAQLPSERISVGSTAIIVPKHPPHFGIKPFAVKAPSNVISENLSQYTWLSFDLIFNMHSETSRYFVVTIIAENSAQAPRVIRNTPPSDKHFRGFSVNDRYLVEDDIAAHLARFISGGDQNCYVGDIATNHYFLPFGDEVNKNSDPACFKDVTEDFG